MTSTNGSKITFWTIDALFTCQCHTPGNGIILTFDGEPAFSEWVVSVLTMESPTKTCKLVKHKLLSCVMAYVLSSDIVNHVQRWTFHHVTTTSTIPTHALIPSFNNQHCQPWFVVLPSPATSDPRPRWCSMIWSPSIGGIWEWGRSKAPCSWFTYPPCRLCIS